MQPPPSLLGALAEAVADGREPDWSSAEAAAGSDGERALYFQLRAIAEIGRCLASGTLSVSSASASVDQTVSRFDPAADAAPSQWGPLVIRERIGRGRFGDVYRAWDPAIDRDVALKLLRRRTPRLDASDAVVVQEGRLMARVRHPNVVAIYGAAHIDSRTGLWMEFIDGRTLDAEVRQRGRYETAEAIRAGIELCRALSAVHEAGLVHRDVKAQNVMRDASGRIVLGDFGTGLDADEDADGRSVIAGTPVYLAPEIFNRAPATPQSDLYSLGVLMFHLLTGSFPVTGRSLDAIRRAHDSGLRQSLRDVHPGIDGRVAEVIERALDPNRSRRFETAAAMELALAGVLAPDQATGDQTRTAESRAPSPQTASRLRATAASVLLIGAVSVLLWTPIRQRQASSPPPERQQAGAGAVVVETQRLSRVPAPSESQYLGRPAADGRSYTFTDMAGNLALFDPATGARRQLTDRNTSGGTTYMSAPFSRDGSLIAYSWQAAEDQWELLVLPATGGDARIVARSGSVIVHPVEWFRDGTRLLVLVERRDGVRHLALLSLADGSTTSVTPSMPDTPERPFRRTDGTWFSIMRKRRTPSSATCLSLRSMPRVTRRLLPPGSATTTDLCGHPMATGSCSSATGPASRVCGRFASLAVRPRANRSCCIATSAARRRLH